MNAIFFRAHLTVFNLFVKSPLVKLQLVSLSFSFSLSLSLCLYYIMVVFCFTEDYDGALSVLTEMAYLAQERGGK